MGRGDVSGPRGNLPPGKWRGQLAVRQVVNGTYKIGKQWKDKTLRALIAAQHELAPGPATVPVSSIAALLLAVAAPSVAEAIDGSALQKGANGYWHIVMPSDLTQSMRDSVPNFTMAADSQYAPLLRESYPYGEHAAPFALIRDLNGDAREDVVFDGREGKDRVVYLAVSRGHAYRWIEVTRESSLRYPRGGLEWHREARGEESWFALARRDHAGSTADAFLWNEGSGLRSITIISCGSSGVR